MSIGCAQNQETEKWQYERNNIISVKDSVKYIDTGDIYISGDGRAYIADNYLIVTDSRAMDELIHIFDKTTFKYIASRIPKGRGPGEIINIGDITSSKEKNELYISDKGKQTIYTYPIDSLLKNNRYIPTKKLSHNKGISISDYEYMSDTLSIGRTLIGIGNNDFKATVAKINFNTENIKFMKYEHPDIKRPRLDYSASLKHQIYVMCYSHHNLISICDLNGNLKYNIYGKGWSTKVSNKNLFYGKSVICKDKIVASYFGGEKFITREDGVAWVNYPDKLIIFDIDGNYLKTLDLGVQVYGINYDEENDRLVFDLKTSLHQFGYLNLEGLL